MKISGVVIVTWQGKGESEKIMFGFIFECYVIVYDEVVAQF